MSFSKVPILRHGLVTRHEAIFPDELMTERIKKVRTFMEEKGFDCLLIYSDPRSNGPVCFLTHYPCFGLGRRAVVVLGKREGPYLFTTEPSRNLPRVRLFTTCDLEKTRQFLTASWDRALSLAGAGKIGLVGFEELPFGLEKEGVIPKDHETEDVSYDYLRLMAIKDAGAKRAMREATSLAYKGINLLTERAKKGMDLWQLASEVDYTLRLAGCEDTNILLGGRRAKTLRPGYPARPDILTGDFLVAYVACIYARYLGVAGRTINIGIKEKLFREKMALLEQIEEEILRTLRPQMTVGEINTLIEDWGKRLQVPLARDIPFVSGLGFDLGEYPKEESDTIEANMTLELCLTADFAEGFTGMRVTSIIVERDGSLPL